MFDLIGKEFKFKTISQGDFGHFRENNLIILPKVAKIALKIVFKLKRFSHKILGRRTRRRCTHLFRFSNFGKSREKPST